MTDWMHPTMLRRFWVRKLIAYLLTSTVLYLLVCYSLARSYLSPMRTVPTLPYSLNEDKVGDVPVWTTPDFGHARVLFVMAHGLGGSRATWDPLIRQLHGKGFDCVAPAMPGQDANMDKTVGFGVKEARTIVETVRWARGKYQMKPKVVLLGISMGGAAAWLASDLDPTVDGVVTEGAYARFDEAMNYWFDRRLPFGNVVFRPVIWFATAMSGIQPADIVPMEAAEKWKGRSALIIQGADDALIQRSHAERLANASGGTLWIVPKACHAGCMDAAGEEYLGRLTEFANHL